MFWALLGAGVIVTLLGVPVGDDATLMKAVEELSAFAKGFDRGALERTLLSHASQQGYVGIDAVARDVRGRGVPKLSAAPKPHRSRRARRSRSRRWRTCRR